MKIAQLNPGHYMKSTVVTEWLTNLGISVKLPKKHNSSNGTFFETSDLKNLISVAEYRKLQSEIVTTWVLLKEVQLVPKRNSQRF